MRMTGLDVSSIRHLGRRARRSHLVRLGQAVEEVDWLVVVAAQCRCFELGPA